MKEILLALACFATVLLVASASIPQFGRCCPPLSLESRIARDLQTVRSQVQLYRIQHNDELPGTTEGVGFVQALTHRTNADGLICQDSGFGPYLDQLPANERNGLNTVEVDGCLGESDFGWYYNTETGEFRADTDPDISL